MFTKSLMNISTLSLLLSSPAVAQNNEIKIEEIVVTAQSRAKGLQHVPVSVSAVDARMIKNTNVMKVGDLTALAPSFTYTESGLTTLFYIRGIGSGANQGFEQSVGVYADGIHFPLAQQSRMPFLDLERVEILRGPQTILFGKNSVAGAISSITAKPTEEFEGSLTGSYEVKDGETIVEGMLSGPLSNRVRARMATRYRNQDGFIQNTTLNRKEPQREEFTVRGTLDIDVTDDMLVRFKVENSNFDSTGRNVEVDFAPAATVGPFAGLNYGQILVGLFGQDTGVLNQTRDGIRSSNGDWSKNQTGIYQMTLDWDIGDHKLQAISAYETMNSDESCDCDFTGANIFLLAIQEDYNQFSQEVRLTSPENDSFDYILGAYFETSNHKYSDQIIVEANSILIPAINLQSPGAGSLLSNTQGGRKAKSKTTVLSAFAQFDWHLSDEVTLQLGGRLTNNDRTGNRDMTIEAAGGGTLPPAQAAAAIVYANAFAISSTNLAAFGPTGAFFIGQLGQPQVNGKRNETSFSSDVKLVWDASDDTMLYTSWTRGNKAGGFDFRANNKGAFSTADDAFQFEPEKVNSYEVGAKFKIGMAAELNISAYLTKFSDLQISIFDSVLGFNVGNAATSKVKGIEVDGRWALSDRIRLSGSASLMDFNFTDFKNGQCYFGQTPDIDFNGDGINELCDYTGKTNTFVSNFSGNIAIDFNYPVLNDYEITGLAKVFYASDYVTSFTYDPVGNQNGVAKIDVRLAFGPQDGPWEIAVLGKNLTDQITKENNFDLPLAGSSFGVKSTTSFYAQGRTIALQAKMRF
ncbi:MAG TPA: TonB-dependent receptor [Sphingomonadales bacterium]|nr:TonB-dependent receptor [Sphingomonadales bacterium]